MATAHAPAAASQIKTGSPDSRGRSVLFLALSVNTGGDAPEERTGGFLIGGLSIT
jgi:hypothetical protein